MPPWGVWSGDMHMLSSRMQVFRHLQGPEGEAPAQARLWGLMCPPERTRPTCASRTDSSAGTKALTLPIPSMGPPWLPYLNVNGAGGLAATSS